MKFSYEVTLHCEGEGCEERESSASEDTVMRARDAALACAINHDWEFTDTGEIICPDCRKKVEAS